MIIINNSKKPVLAVECEENLIDFAPKESKGIPDEYAADILSAHPSLKEFKEVKKKSPKKKK